MKVLVVFACVAALAIPAAAEEWVCDYNHSKLKFAIEARMIGAEGIFHKYAVKADVDEKALENTKLEVTIDMSTIDTNAEGRDRHLKTPDFFDVAKFPESKIVVKSIKKISDTNYEGDGEITMHGVTKSVKLPARVLINEGGILRFRGQVDLNRKDFGMTYDRGPNKIEDTATVTYEFNLRKPQNRPAGGAAPKGN